MMVASILFAVQKCALHEAFAGCLALCNGFEFVDHDGSIQIEVTVPCKNASSFQKKKVNDKGRHCVGG